MIILRKYFYYIQSLLDIFGIPLFTFVGIQFCGGCVDVLVMFLCLVASSYTPVCQAAAQYT